MNKGINFIEVFSMVEAKPFMATATVLNIKISKKAKVMHVFLAAPYGFSEREQEEIKACIIKAFDVNQVILEVKKTAPKEEKIKTKDRKVTSVIKGKAINAKVLDRIKDIDETSGTVIIEGDIFGVNIHETKKGNIIFSFDITDQESSVSAKMILKPGDAKAYKESIKKGIRIRMRAETRYDKFDKEVCLYPYDMMQIESLPQREDNHAEKRVELHVHTKMSAMDSVVNTKDIVKKAAEFGHKAIAITDHGVVQAFPDAYDAGKENNIKIIYGVECYLVGDEVEIVSGDTDKTIQDRFVVFDIETTGLSSINDKIIEIGAVVVEGGEIKENFSQLIDPGFPVGEFTTRLTGITNQMLEGKPSIEEVLPRFLQFIEGSVLVAHNAGFDCGFMSVNAERLGYAFEFARLDTVEFSRALLPNLKKHKLDSLAKHFKIDMGFHHRADDDANTTAHILLKLFDMLCEKEITKLYEINSALSDEGSIKKHIPRHCILLVKNQEGIKNLYKIISDSHLKYFYKKPRVPKSLLNKHRKGLIVGTACEAGELYTAIIEGKNEEEIKKIARYYDYFEIQPTGNNRFLVKKGMALDDEQLEDINHRIVALGKELGKKVVAACDVHFLEPEDSIFRTVIMAGLKYDDADNQAPLYFRTTEEMLEEFSYLGEDLCYEVVIKNPNLICDMIDSDVMPIPRDTFVPEIPGAKEDVRRLSEENAHKIYGEILPKPVEERMNKELDSIIKYGFAVMYVLAQKLVWKSVADGYLVGSRGSVGSSFVAFLMGITEVNALAAHYVCPKCKYSEFIEGDAYACGFDMPDKVCLQCGENLNKDGQDIPFETFLGFEGDKEPDIDLNFSGEYQSEAHKYTEELFGPDHVFRAGTISALAEKTAYGYVLKYAEERQMELPSAEKRRLAAGCEGVKKTTGQHPGGMVLVPRHMDIYDFCPIQRPADKTESDTITTHFDYNNMKGRLLKFDILGHDDPTMLKMLGDLTGVDVTKIPLDDPDVMSLFTSTEALGYLEEHLVGDHMLDNVGTYAVPEFGTAFVRQMLKDTKPKKFSELVRISGLSHGTNVWLNNAQELVSSNVITLSEAICTRDDIMIYLMQRGMEPKDAFDIMEDIRKGKRLEKHPELEEKMRQADLASWYIGSCKKISYMFPKAHAAAYVMMAFRIAYFKVHYPEAFYTTYFTVRADEFEAKMMANGIEKVRQTLREMRDAANLSAKEQNVYTILEVCNEMYSRGYAFDRIDIYKSHATKFTKGENGIRPPLAAYSGMGVTAAKSVAQARTQGEFISIDDLKRRTGISKTVIETLKEEGCLEGFLETSQLSFLA